MTRRDLSCKHGLAKWRPVIGQVWFVSDHYQMSLKTLRTQGLSGAQSRQRSSYNHNPSGLLQTDRSSIFVNLSSLARRRPDSIGDSTRIACVGHADTARNNC